jgi:hypothetical protein
MARDAVLFFWFSISVFTEMIDKTEYIDGTAT